MEVTIGEKGLEKTQQAEFPKTTECCRCKGVARISFVAHEGMSNRPTVIGEKHTRVCDLHRNKSKGGYWLHDLCAVAVYFCKECLETTAHYNQG